MIAVDTNILLYAHRRDAPEHDPAAAAVARLAEGPEGWAIPWPCIHEFLAVGTDSRVVTSPSAPETALAQVEMWLRSPTLRLLAEGPGYGPILASILRESRVTGGRVHDARIGALCIYHGVSELWTADRDFAWFPRLRTRNPLRG